MESFLLFFLLFLLLFPGLQLLANNLAKDKYIYQDKDRKIHNAFLCNNCNEIVSAAYYLEECPYCGKYNNYSDIIIKWDGLPHWNFITFPGKFEIVEGA